MVSAGLVKFNSFGLVGMLLTGMAHFLLGVTSGAGFL